MKRALVIGAILLLAGAAPALAADPPVIVFSPEPPALTKDPNVTFAFSAGDGATLACSLDGAPATACTPPVMLVLAEGSHVFAVHASNADGSADAQRTVVVDTTPPAAPVVTAPAEGSAQQSTTVALAGTAEAGAKVDVSEGADAVASATADGSGAWAVSIAGVAEGAHAYTATATDPAGNTGAASAALRVRVDHTPPPAPVVSGGPDTFEFSSDEAGVLLECGLDAGALSPCSSPQSFPGLAPGAHTLSVRATDQAGNASTTEFPFSVPEPLPAPTATPAPAATPIAVPAATPIAIPAAVLPSFGQSVVLRPSQGRTLIRLPRAAASAELHSKTAVPLGTTVDARAGVVVVTAVNSAAGKPETAQFTGGIFTVAQPGNATELALSATLRCGRTRTLTGDGAGAFRIRGRFATATGSGAKWLVQDSCRSTLVRVTRGVVAVLNARTRHTTLVRAGRHYEVRPKR